MMQDRGINGFFEPNENLGFTGEVGEKHPGSEQWAVAGRLYKGKKQGRWVGFFDNGNKAFDGSFIEGKLEGFCNTWHWNGRKRSEAYYELGKDIRGMYWNTKGEVIEKKSHLEDNSQFVPMWRVQTIGGPEFE